MGSKQAARLVEVARSYIGYLEKATNRNLDDFTANAGTANFTKFGKWYGLNAQPWCAIWGSFVAFAAGIPTTVVPKFALCSTGVNWFKKRGRWHARAGYVPKPGDYIFFTLDGKTPAHVGIVERVFGGRVYTIEGNTSGGAKFIANGGGVADKSYPLGYAGILGYGNPGYDAEGSPGALLRRGCTGEAVKTLQARLKELGFDCGAVDGDFGERTLGAVLAFQRARGIEVDGVVGVGTWGELGGYLSGRW